MLSFVNLADTPSRTNMQYRLDFDPTTSGDDVYTIAGVELVIGTVFADRKNFDDSLTGNERRNKLSGLAWEHLPLYIDGIGRLLGGICNGIINGGDGLDDALLDGDHADYTLTRTRGMNFKPTGRAVSTVLTT